MEGARGCSGPREQHTPRGDVAVAPPPSVHDGSSGDAGGLLGLLPANTAHEPTEHLRFLLQAGRAQEAADFLGGLQKVPNDSGFDDDSSSTFAALAVHCPEGTAEPPATKRRSVVQTDTDGPAYKARRVDEQHAIAEEDEPEP